MNQKQIENKALLVTTVVNAVVAFSGIWVYSLTNLQTLFLDGFFSLIALASTVMAVLISKQSRKETKDYPHGLFFMEPLYAVTKSVLMIVLMVVALLSASKVAVAYFMHGEGQVMNTAPLPAYAVAMTVLCLGLGLYNRQQYIKTNRTSTILRAEYQTNIIDGLQSAVIGTAIVLMKFIPLESSFGFLHYTGDFFIALLVIVVSIKEPIKLFFDAFRELTGGVTKNKEIISAVSEATGMDDTQFEVYKVGMKIKVCIFVVSIEQTVFQKKQEMLEKLQQTYECCEIRFVC